MEKVFFLTAWGFLVISCDTKMAGADKAISTEDSTSITYEEAPACELADAKYTDISKRAMAQFESGDIDGWLTHYADQAVIRQSPVDSIYGKPFIAKLWKDRRKTQTGSIKIKNDVWLPLKINRPQPGDDLEEGIWVLNWHHVDLQLKNGDRQQFWVHTDFHFDKMDKIDIMLEYFDPGPKIAAKKN
jgi:hypothetical protein